VLRRGDKYGITCAPKQGDHPQGHVHPARPVRAVPRLAAPFGYGDRTTQRIGYDGAKMGKATAEWIANNT